MKYSKSTINKLLDHICISKIVAYYIPCWPRKNNKTEYVALCPFHSENTGSLTVTTVKQFYHCFGCGAHGNAIAFVMEYVGMDFISATKAVARIGRFHLPNGETPSRKKLRDRQRYRTRKEKKITHKEAGPDLEKEPRLTF